jgi:hypothetical protein
MADVQKIIDSLNVIVKAKYKGSPSSRPTFKEQAFKKLQGSAEQVEAILTQNRNPTPDQKENISAQFETMEKNLESYCVDLDGTQDVFAAFQRASTEWAKLVSGQ